MYSTHTIPHAHQIMENLLYLVKSIVYDAHYAYVVSLYETGQIYLQQWTVSKDEIF